MFAFFSSTIGRIVGIVALVAIVLGIGYFLYKDHDRLVRSEALAHYNQTQLEQVVKEKADLEQKLKVLADKADQLALELQTDKQKLDDRSNEIDSVIENDKSDDRESSKVLKDTIKELLK
jgi:hypothetical protein